MSEATIERYTVLKTMHMGVIGRNLKSGSVIEWDPESQVMIIDGHRLIEDKKVNPAEAMRQLKLLGEKGTPAIEPLGINKGFETSDKFETKTLCIVPILQCLHELVNYMENEVGVNPVLEPVNEEQEIFLDSFGDMIDDVSEMDCVKGKAARGSAEINKWLKDEGFNIQLPKTKELSVAAIMRVIIEWLYEGKTTYIQGVDGKEYEAVSMKSNGVTISHVVQAHKHPVVRIAGKNGETVCMSMIDEMPITQEGMFLKISELDGVRAGSHQFQGVSFPIVDLDDQPDISWISGMGLFKDTRIDKALQQTRFKMDEKGAKVESAAAMTTYRSVSRDMNHIIDRPFLLWVMRPELDFPVFASVICEDAWISV